MSAEITYKPNYRSNIVGGMSRTAWIFPKRFIDATGDYDPYAEAMQQAEKETKQ